MHLTASLCLDEMIEGFADDPALQLAVKRHAEVMTHHKRHKDRSRWLAMLRHVESNRDRNCRNTSSLNGALHERDGLVSYWSSGTQKRRISALGYYRVGDVFGQCSFKALRVHLVADERKEVRRETADNAFRRQFL